jgi:hypothetical protein
MELEGRGDLDFHSASDSKIGAWIEDEIRWVHNREWTAAVSARQTRIRCVNEREAVRLILGEEGDGGSTLDLEMEMEILGQYSIEMKMIGALR